MKTYIALLRAINVGGRWVAMETLRQIMSDAEFENVRTYINTGNVIFESNQPKPVIHKTIEAALLEALGYEVKAFVLEPRELVEAATHNPFEPAKLDSQQHCHIVFLSAEPSRKNADKLMDLAGEEYRFAVLERVLYYAYDRKYEGRNRRAINFEKVLGVEATARTWKVIDKLIAMAGEK